MARRGPTIQTAPEQAHAQASAGPVWRTALVVFIANCGILVLQLVTGKLLSPYIGVSLATWTSVIGVFMLGISVGNWLGGRLADRAPSTRTLARLLAAGAVTIVVTLGLVWLLGDGAAVRPLPLLPRIALLTFLVGFPTSFVLSLITPVAIRVLLPDVRQAGRVVGLIYALGTLGSLVGNFLTGFLLIAYLPLNTIVLLVVVGLALMAAVTWFGGSVGAVPAAAEAESGAGVTAATGGGGLNVVAAGGIVFAASFCTMLIELAASRVLAPFLGVSLFSWTGVIGVVLIGITIGNYAGGWLADRRPRLAVLGSTLLLGGLFSLAIIPLLGKAVLEPWYSTVVLWTGASALMSRIVLAAATLFLAPVLFLGMTSPQVIRLAVTDVQHAGRIAGRLYAWSTVGAIVGTFAAGWFLISWLGVNTLVFLAGGGLVALALCLMLWKLQRHVAMAAGLVVLTLLLGVRMNVDAVRAFDDSTLRTVPWWPGVANLVTSRCTKETNYYCIRAYHDGNRDGGVMVLVLDHLVHSYVKPEDPTYLGYQHEQVQVEFTQLAAERAGGAPNVLLIGGGGYTYPRWVEARVPRAQIDVVEIDPGVTDVAREYLGLAPTTRIASHNLDGRQFVQELAAKNSYHLIVQDAVNDLSVPGHIMTREYNEHLKAIMTDDGVYLLSVIDLYDDGQLLRSAVRTMMQTWPQVHLLAVAPSWQTGGAAVYIVYGSQHPLDLAALDAAVKRQGGTPLTVVQNDAALREYVAAGPQIILTDQYSPVDNLISILFAKRFG